MLHYMLLSLKTVIKLGNSFQPVQTITRRSVGECHLE